MRPQAGATVEDLYRVQEDEHIGASTTTSGSRQVATLFPDTVGSVVDLPRPGSFSPDAAFHTGPLRGGKFVDGAPIFTAEVRSEGDHGPKAERGMAQKRTDYFAAGMDGTSRGPAVVVEIRRAGRR